MRNQAFAMQGSLCRHPELCILGRPAFSVGFLSDQCDIHHMSESQASRFNGLHPGAIHMCITRPQTELGVVAAFARDYAKSPPREQPISGAIYGHLRRPAKKRPPA